MTICRFPTRLNAVLVIPLAFYRAVQWLYARHAVIIDGPPAWRARAASRQAVKGDWRRTLGMALLIAMVSSIPGPIAGTLVVVVAKIDLDTADNIASLVYVLVYPLATIASTLD